MRAPIFHANITPSGHICSCAIEGNVQGCITPLCGCARRRVPDGKPETPQATMRVKSLFAGALSLLALAACSGEKAASVDSTTAAAKSTADSASAMAKAATDTAKAAMDSMAKGAMSAADSVKGAAAAAMDKAGDKMKDAADKMKPAVKKP